GDIGGKDGRESALDPFGAQCGPPVTAMPFSQSAPRQKTHQQGRAITPIERRENAPGHRPQSCFSAGRRAGVRATQGVSTLVVNTETKRRVRCRPVILNSDYIDGVEVKLTLAASVRSQSVGAECSASKQRSANVSAMRVARASAHATSRLTAFHA